MLPQNLLRNFKKSRESDEENDEDYIPNEEGESDSSEDEREPKRARTQSPRPPPSEESLRELQKRNEALWAEFQTAVNAEPLKAEPPKPKTIKIERKRLFAGEEVVEVLEVLEDSPEAKKFQAQSTGNSTSTPSPDSPAPKLQDTSNTPNTPRPGPRKSKTLLTPTPSKLKKMSTLERSAMDWKTYVSEEPALLKDELEANRRGGGYLEKVAFLQRVDGRKDNALENAKSGKRRRD